MIDLSTRRIGVTGGKGFLGAGVLNALRDRGCRDVFAPGIDEYNLARINDIKKFFSDGRPEVLFHLAAAVGGIGANQRNPGRFFYENAIMGLELIEEARRRGVEKVIVVGTTCSYPKNAPVPFREETLWDGYPEEVTAPYGIAKKMLLVQCQTYRKEYGMNAIFLMPVNLYGPGDNFDPASSHVVPALIHKCVEAKRLGASEIVCWGDGTATREFLYVEDAAEGLLSAAERYDDDEPVNLGSGEETSIRELTRLIAETVRFGGKVVWDSTKPNGQPRRCLEISRAEQRFGFRAKTRLPLGLAKTVDWYVRNLPNGIAVSRQAAEA